MSTHSIEVRNLRFPLGAEVPKQWFGETQSCTTFWDNLSVLFPAGERFFMNSVRAFENQLKDGSKLKDEVRLFYQQEALHSREHVRYNDMLRAHGYPIDQMDKSVRTLLDNVAKLPEDIQLAVTCALEHFTAMLAQGVLAEDSPFEVAHPVMGALWRWHAAEENEHASVAFDVYKEVGGNYPVRVVVMAVATLIFWAKVVEQQVRMMNADGTLTSTREWSALGRFLFKKPGWLFKMAKPYLAYYKPSFHPAELDCTHLLARWQKEFEALNIYRESLRPPPKLARAS